MFHQGLGNHLGIGIGWAGVVTSVGVLLLWIPLKMKPHIGTVLNALVIWSLGGILSVDHGRAGKHRHPLVLYAGRHRADGDRQRALSAGKTRQRPRDGVMVGLNKKFGFSIRLARTIIEVMALVIDYLLGGTVGLGTLVVALRPRAYRAGDAADTALAGRTRDRCPAKRALRGRALMKVKRIVANIATPDVASAQKFTATSSPRSPHGPWLDRDLWQCGEDERSGQRRLGRRVRHRACPTSRSKSTISTQHWRA